MSHNPTYDPEPGYNSYGGGDRSGHSTPPQFYSGSSLPASDTGPYTNMASYRQATSGPPGSSGYTEPPAGNGKSYRFATAEPIPEDDGGDMSPVADTRQVQFTDLGSEKNNMGRNGKAASSGMSSDGSDKKFMILAAVAALFALLFIIFLALFIWKATSDMGPEVTGPVGGDTGKVVNGNASTAAGVIQSTEQGSTRTNPATEKPSVSSTTPMPDLIVETELEMYEGTMVTKYIMSNTNNVNAEVISLGARLNTLTKGTMVMIKGMDLNNLTDVGADTTKAWLGPVCGRTHTLHKEHFTRVTTMDGSLRLEKVINRVKVAFVYTLDDNDKLMVKITGTPDVTNVETPMDICSSNEFNLNAAGSGDITDTHKLQIPADQQYSNGGFTDIGTGLSDFRKSADVGPLIKGILNIDSKQVSDERIYRLEGPSGLRHGATIDSTTTTPKMMIQTSQTIMKLYIPLQELTFIRLIARNAPGDAGETDPDRIVLKSGSIYEFAISYSIIS